MCVYVDTVAFCHLQYTKCVYSRNIVSNYRWNIRSLTSSITASIQLFAFTLIATYILRYNTASEFYLRLYVYIDVNQLIL